MTSHRISNFRSAIIVIIPPVPSQTYNPLNQLYCIDSMPVMNCSVHSLSGFGFHPEALTDRQRKLDFCALHVIDTPCPTKFAQDASQRDEVSLRSNCSPGRSRRARADENFGHIVASRRVFAKEV